MILQQKCSIYCILFTDQISLSHWLYFLRYWAICVSQLFVNQAVTSKISKLIWPFWSRSFHTWTKSQDKNLSILRTKRVFKVDKIMKNKKGVELVTSLSLIWKTFLEKFLFWSDHLNLEIVERKEKKLAKYSIS